jgi:hypothetical protein
MSGTGHKNISDVALTLVGMLAMQSALAAPPLHPQWQTQWQARQQSAVQTRLQPAVTMPQRLDLRAPSVAPELADDGGSKGFPSRRSKLGGQEVAQLPELGSESARARPTVQEFVRRVRREGLPVARLYEGRSALVHLGLNPKGKPGLWLVQKTR